MASCCLAAVESRESNEATFSRPLSQYSCDREQRIEKDRKLPEYNDVWQVIVFASSFFFLLPLSLPFVCSF